MITPEQLDAFAPGTRSWADAINAAAARFSISTPHRMAAFLAQTAHESASFTRLVESLNYSAEGLASTWPGRYRGPDGQPNDTARLLHRNPEAIANHCYANRMGNGDEASGDGWRYRGRGLIHLTGRSNHQRCAAGIGLPLIEQPELLEQPGPAALAAGWFWAVNGLNELADAAAFAAITKRINGGLHGHDDRVRRWQRALHVLGIEANGKAAPVPLARPKRG